ncbi:MAG TPA: hypothetical protein VMV45_09080, partial [Casimicrobiaceae bacterium]|nr:hypothetical protein [Casimicrobiaceae bacterium]
MDPARYRARYIAALPAAAQRARAPTELPPLGSHHWYPPGGQTEAAPLALPELFTAGVECGHTEARLELKRRIVVVDAQLEQFRSVRDKAQDDREQLASDLLVTQRELVRMRQQAADTQVVIGQLQTTIGQ